MILDLNTETVLFGKAVPNTNLGQTLAMALMNLTGTNIASANTLTNWAHVLDAQHPISIEIEDTQLFISAIDSPQLNVLPFVKCQIIDAFNAQKHKEDSEILANTKEK